MYMTNDQAKRKYAFNSLIRENSKSLFYMQFTWLVRKLWSYRSALTAVTRATIIGQSLVLTPGSQHVKPRVKRTDESYIGCNKNSCRIFSCNWNWAYLNFLQWSAVTFLWWWTCSNYMPKQLTWFRVVYCSIVSALSLSLLSLSITSSLSTCVVLVDWLTD